MKRKSLIFSVFAASILFSAAPGFAQSSLECQAGSGVWKNVSQNPVLEGVLCTQTGDGYDFYRFDFDSQKGQFAPAIPNADGTVRYLFASPKVIFYADNSTVYGVEREHFRVIFHRPWLNAQTLPADADDASHLAIISQTESGYELHLLKAGTLIEEEMNSSLGPEPPIKVVWHSKRLIVIERNRLIYWPRPGIPLSPNPNDPAAEQVVPQNWMVPPTIVDINPDLIDGDYELDPDGLMVLNRAAKKLSYYRFNSQSWTTARINATASIQGLGFGTKYAMGVTIDANTVRVVARLGAFLQNRFEAKYWKLPSASETIVVGQDDIAALDGGSDNRVQTFDTTEMTWKRLALIEYSNPGRMAELLNDELISIHGSGTDALIIWNARTGARISSLAAEKLAELDFGSIQSARTVPGFKRYKLLVSQSELFAIFDTKTGSISQPQPFEKVPWSDLPKAVELTPEAMIVHSGDANSSQWDIYPVDEKKEVSRKSLADFQSKVPGELQSPKEKWYGYCLDGKDDCFKSTMTPPEQNRKSPEISISEAPPSHAPTSLSWILCIFAFIAMFAVTGWRHGFGRKSLLKADSGSDDELAPTDIFDDKNRRYISDRDNRLFLAPHWSRTPEFRVMLSVILGLAVGVLVSVPFIRDDTYSTFLSWIIILGMPVTAITWIATSWTYWNRYYLLRFGCLTEGKWLNSAQTNPSIIYEPVPGVTYELDRSQWKRVDFVPMILFDPARPRFAIQYTGGSSHVTVQNGNMEAKPSRACVFDLRRLSIVLGVMAATIVLTQGLFQNAYPNPLSAWKLDSIADFVSNPDAGVTFTTACLQECSEDDACFKQCHQRQLRLVLSEAGIEMPFDPEMTTAEFLNNYRSDVAKARAILLDQPELSCQERDALIADINPWPDQIANAFWRTYSNPETFEVSRLNDIYQGLKEDITMLRALCDESGVCTQSSQNCPEPPTCPGSVTALKARVCAFQDALNLPEVNLARD